MQLHRFLFITTCFLMLQIGCDKKEPSTPSANATHETKVDPESSREAIDEADQDERLLATFDPKVMRATKIAERIELDPENAEEVLAEAALDREGLDEMMYEIAADPELAAQYRIARGIR